MFSDIDDLFGRNPVTNDVIEDVDDQSVRNSMRSLVLTSKGERPFLPFIGSDVKSSLFENYSGATAYVIERAIKEVIQNFEPRVILNNVEVVDDIDNNRFTINIAYRIVTDTNVNRNLTMQI
jgi:hypothetical protein